MRKDEDLHQSSAMMWPVRWQISLLLVALGVALLLVSAILLTNVCVQQSQVNGGLIIHSDNLQTIPSATLKPPTWESF